jgi:hypothetical protein
MPALAVRSNQEAVTLGSSRDRRIARFGILIETPQISRFRGPRPGEVPDSSARKTMRSRQASCRALRHPFETQ